MVDRTRGLRPMPLGRRLSQRAFLTVAAAGMSALLSACGAGATASPSAPASLSPTASTATSPSPEAFDWRRYEGTTITALFSNNPQAGVIESLIPEFEELTGITVEFQSLELAAMRDKQNVVFTSGSSEIDVWHTFPIQESVQYARAGWYEDLEPYLADPALTAGDYNIDDMRLALPMDSVNVAGGQYGLGSGQLVGMPLWIEVWPLYYNKALLDAAGVEVPTTMDELEAAAKAIHDPDNGVYGYVTRGTSPLNTGSSVNAFYSMGARWTDDDGKAALDSPEAAAFLDWHGRMMREYGPPNAYTLDIGAANDLFKGGKVGFYADSPGFLGPLADPETSLVAEHLGVAPWPAGPAGSRVMLDNWAATVSKFSTKKEAAWFFVQYLTGPKGGLELSKTGVIPARDSVASSDEYLAFINEIAPNLPDIRDHGLANGVVQVFPPVSAVGQARQLWGDAMVAAVQGTDPEELAADANQKLQDLLDAER